MNNALRKSINVKCMLRRKNDRVSNKHNWDLYRKQRNLCTQLKKTIHSYLYVENMYREKTIKWNCIRGYS